MIASIGEITRKVRKDGLKAAFKAAGRRIHSNLFYVDWDFELVPGLLERLMVEQGSLSLIQIGANVGDTGSDQLCKFLKSHCAIPAPNPPRIRAVLVEPVGHLFRQLQTNYASCPGVVCVNAAIAERPGVKPFYRMREGIDLAGHGLPLWAEELGSFLREHMDCLWRQQPGNARLREFVETNIVVDQVPCMTFRQLVEQNGVEQIDLLQVDTEGYDYQILRTIDFSCTTPRHINYERIHLHGDEAACRRLLLGRGYSLHDHGQDTLCTLGERQGFWRRLCERSYVAWLDAIH